MKVGWRFFIAVLTVCILGISLLAPAALANGNGKGRGEWKHGDVGEPKEHGHGWNRAWGVYGGYYGPYGYQAAYPAAYPVAYPVFVPANYGGNAGACYQACLGSGQYAPAQCGQMCQYY